MLNAHVPEAEPDDRKNEAEKAGDDGYGGDRYRVRGVLA